MEKIKSRKPLNEQEIQTVIQQLWLTYYNDTLFFKGLQQCFHPMKALF